MSAILAFLKSLYQHKEKIILGILLIAFVSVAYVQVKAKKKTAPENGGDNPVDIIKFDPKPARKAAEYPVPVFDNPFGIKKHLNLIQRDIFVQPKKETTRGKEDKKEEWADIRVKSVFDPTQSGSYIAIIEVDKRSRIVKVGDQFGVYEVERVDGVRNCLTIYWSQAKEVDNRKEFCKED